MLAWPITDNLARVKERVARACDRARRSPEEITLVAVSKTFPAEAIRAAYDCGIRHFGENRVQEWEEKCEQLSDLRDATWHLVGHLQSNKARKAAQLFHRIDSVDSLAIAERLARNILAPSSSARFVSATPGKESLGVLIEVRLVPEVTKSGISPEELPALAEGILALPQLELRGLMCIPPFFENPENVRSYFRHLHELREELRSRFASHFQSPTSDFLPHLSMGMSHDFEIAIEEKATEIRVGTALFGARGAP